MWYKDAEEFKSINGYDINGTWYPRVTKILDVKAKPALEQFFREMESFASAEEVKNKSAAEGTLVHETVQGLLTGKEVSIPEAILPAVSAFQKFNEEKQIVFHKEYVESRVVSLRHRYAGTVDALATVDGKFGVLDIKTSTGFYPEYNLQTAAYVSALQEFPVKRLLSLPRDIETRWILRINQHRICALCKSVMREKGGRVKVKNGKGRKTACEEGSHEWSETQGDIELKEFPYLYQDIKAFVAAKILWEWENNYWLKKVDYLQS